MKENHTHFLAGLPLLGIYSFFSEAFLKIIMILDAQNIELKEKIYIFWFKHSLKRCSIWIQKPKSLFTKEFSYPHQRFVDAWTVLGSLNCTEAGSNSVCLYSRYILEKNVAKLTFAFKNYRSEVKQKSQKKFKRKPFQCKFIFCLFL